MGRFDNSIEKPEGYPEAAWRSARSEAEALAAGQIGEGVGIVAVPGEVAVELPTE